tara:strand:+ start:3069 stop:3560 length:492 start_codon:yes stop_codon:yes gene_type:complete
MSETDYIRDRGSRALGARLRRISEAIDLDATRCYALTGLKFEQRWFGTLNQLRLKGRMSVGEIAAVLGVTHVSVSQARKSLELNGLIAAEADPRDGRRTLLALTAAGEALVDRLNPLWESFEAVAAEIEAEAGGVIAALERLENSLKRQSFQDRVRSRFEADQ